MIAALSGNMAEEFFNVLIVFLLFFKYRFRHGIVLKVPV